MRSEARLPTFRLAAVALLPAVFLLVTTRGPFSDLVWRSATLAFWLIVVVTLLCALGALVVSWLGWRRRLAEVAILGSSLFAVSVLPLVHGLTVPGVLYGENPATTTAAFLAVPVGVIVALPLILPDLRPSHILARRWRWWSAVTIVAAAALATLLLVDPGLIPAPRFGSPLTYACIAVSIAGTLTLAFRQLRLYAIGRRRGSLLAALGFVYLGLSTLVFLVEQPFSIGWWAAHLVDAIGVLAAIFGLAFAHVRDRSLAAMLAPLVNRDPLVALELGLTPLVHDFVAALERKDAVTRDHVIRVGELSMRVGVRAGLDGGRLRALGIGALLHDVGKLFTPDGVLKKPGRLTDDEFDEIREHPAQGAELMRGSRLLEPAADLVLWHHERADGTGYPYGLRVGDLPVEVSIISVSDGWDAMTSSRHYRSAMGVEQARRVMREGAGTQWTDAAVGLLLAELAEAGPVAAPAFSGVGRARALRAASLGEGPLEVCREALPERVRLPV